MIQVEVDGIRLELPSNQPVLILRDPATDRYLPLWIGASEATAISIALEGVSAPRPLTHDLMVTMIEVALITGPRTPDLGGNASTQEMGAAIAARVAG